MSNWSLDETQIIINYLGIEGQAVDLTTQIRDVQHEKFFEDAQVWSWVTDLMQIYPNNKASKITTIGSKN